MSAVVVSVSAQSKQLKSADKLLKKKNFAEAEQVLNSVSSAIESSNEPKLKSYYYYLKAILAYGDKTESHHKTALDASNKVVKFEADNGISKYSKLANTIVTSITSKYKNAIKTAEAAGTLELAGDNYVKLYNLFPSDTVSLINAAYSYNKVANNEKSIEVLKTILASGYTGITATEKESQKPKYFKVLLSKYLETKQNDKALALLESEPTIVSKDANLNIQLANLHYNAGNQQGYITAIEKAAEIAKTNADLYYNIGIFYQNSDQTKAIAAFEKAIELKSDYKNAYSSIGGIYLANTNNIVKKINANLENEANYNKYNNELKEVYKKAAPYMFKAYELDKTDAVLKKNLISIYKKIGDKEKLALLQ